MPKQHFVSVFEIFCDHVKLLLEHSVRFLNQMIPKMQGELALCSDCPETFSLVPV